MATGAVLDSRSVGNDGRAETVDNCAAAVTNDCRQIKNALQADPVATGPNDSRYISKVYIGDLDGKIWRFDVGQGASGAPAIQQMLSLYTIGSGGGKALDAGLNAWEQPIFASMATVSIGYSQQYLFIGTGSDLQPRNSVNTQYALLVILDQGSSGTVTAINRLELTDGSAGDEKVSSFPAVAGDIVFFSTTTYKAVACSKPDANLYALTFIGGPAYDTNHSGSLTSTDSTKIRTTVGSRATAPFIVDQHLVFGTGDNVELFGDPQDFNNGVGQAGVRILSWREVR
jgi:Tfp pilus tip-associated adhesin PilY1